MQQPNRSLESDATKHRVCPWWMGYMLASPLRRLWHNPKTILNAYLAPGMIVLEPGPGMGFFTLEMARLVGPKGRVIAADIQLKMLESLLRRAKRAGLVDRIEVREVKADQLGVEDLKGKVDFILAFAVVHELPDASRFFSEAKSVLKPGCKILLAEPQKHVTEEEFAVTLEAAARAGFHLESRPDIRSSRSAVLVLDSSEAQSASASGSFLSR